jgi:hypothetical protein
VRRGVVAAGVAGGGLVGDVVVVVAGREAVVGGAGAAVVLRVCVFTVLANYSCPRQNRSFRGPLPTTQLG